MTPDEYADKRITIILDQRHRKIIDDATQRSRDQFPERKGLRTIKASAIIRALLEGAATAKFDLAAESEVALKKRVAKALAK